MKTTHILMVVIGLIILSAPPSIAAKELSAGRLVYLQNQVTSEPSPGASQVLKENDILQEKIPALTGEGALAEIHFSDGTVVRLSANSKFSFLSKERLLRIDQGALMVNVPEGNGGIRIESGDGEYLGEATGTTLMASRATGGSFALVVLETKGTVRFGGKNASPTALISGQVALIGPGQATSKVFEVNLDAVIQFSALIARFPFPMQGMEAVETVATTQAGEIQVEAKFLLAYKDVGLKAEDSEKNPLALIFGKNPQEMVDCRNPFLGDLSTAAGAEEQKDSSVVLGGKPGEGGSVSDARQAEGEEIASKSNPRNDSPGGGLGDTDTAAGTEDVSGTDTAAGGGGAPDTQAPAPVGGGTTINPNPATDTRRTT